eukprot:353890-Chlamydomonas_euryale.AAC.3
MAASWKLSTRQTIIKSFVHKAFIFVVRKGWPLKRRSSILMLPWYELRADQVWMLQSIAAWAKFSLAALGQQGVGSQVAVVRLVDLS